MDKERKRIDEINKEIENLLEERLLLVKKIGDYKRKNNIPIYDPQREKEILDRINPSNPELKDYLKEVFKTILEISKKNE